MFKPLHRDHAIETVFLRLTGSGEMMEHERVNLQRGYAKSWKAVLPSVTQAQVMEIALGPTPLVDGRPKPLAPTTYVEYLRTGNAAWWMEIAGPTITIGCTQYSGWESVSGKAFELFRGLGNTLGPDHPLANILNTELTYVNLLRWNNSEENYDPRLAIQKHRIPLMAKKSKQWHLSEGWVSDPEKSRILERFQISGELPREGNREIPIIRVETTAIWGFGETNPRLNLNRAFAKLQEVSNEENDGRAIFDELHRRAKVLLETLITDDIANLIGLRKPGELK